MIRPFASGRVLDAGRMREALQALLRPGDRVALERVINVPARGIGDKTVSELKAWADARGAVLSLDGRELRRADVTAGVDVEAHGLRRRLVAGAIPIVRARLVVNCRPDGDAKGWPGQAGDG